MPATPQRLLLQHCGVVASPNFLHIFRNLSKLLRFLRRGCFHVACWKPGILPERNKSVWLPANWCCVFFSFLDDLNFGGLYLMSSQCSYLIEPAAENKICLHGCYYYYYLPGFQHALEGIGEQPSRIRA